MAPEMYKKRLLESKRGDTTLTNTLTGLWARSLANSFTREYSESGAPVLPPLVQRGAASDVFVAALMQGDPDS
jgi:NAD(P)H-dependent flavin oxidoreductase YrpB (nitropropane dioxygenase family)